MTYLEDASRSQSILHLHADHSTPAPALAMYPQLSNRSQSHSILSTWLSRHNTEATTGTLIRKRCDICTQISYAQCRYNLRQGHQQEVHVEEELELVEESSR